MSNTSTAEGALDAFFPSAAVLPSPRPRGVRRDVVSDPVSAVDDRDHGGLPPAHSSGFPAANMSTPEPEDEVATAERAARVSWITVAICLLALFLVNGTVL